MEEPPSCPRKSYYIRMGCPFHHYYHPIQQAFQKVSHQCNPRLIFLFCQDLLLDRKIYWLTHETLHPTYLL